jgi:hypothetical protein
VTSLNKLIDSAQHTDSTTYDAKADALSNRWAEIKDGNLPDNIPFFVTGARAFIRVGGRQLAFCQSISWKLSYNSTPIYTIDAIVPWDIDVGQLRVQAKLDRLITPIMSPEQDSLFTIMSAAAHQPMVELQVLDAVGTSLFYSKGMFTDVSSSINLGSLSTFSANFIGTVYQHYVAQQFKPYGGFASAAGELINGLDNIG